MRFVKKINERGVMTLPAEVREALGIQDGDIVEIEVLNIIRPRTASTPEEPIPLAGGTA